MHSAQSSRRSTMDPDYDSTTTSEQGNHDYYSAYSAYNSNPYEESVSEPVQQPQPQRQSQARLSRSSVQGPGSPKRRSVFSARSRNTSTSSHRSPSTSADPAVACQDAVAATAAVAAAATTTTTTSTTAAYPPLRTERQDSLTKSLFNRGSRILRRQGSKFSISATLDEVDEEREKPRFDVTDLFGRRSRQSSTNDNLKRLISDPYDFHHLTHTSPSHVQSLQRARENDLVTEFSAIRASQKPDTSLKGIRAEDLHFPDVPRCTTPGVATAGDDEHAYAIPTATAVATSPPASPGALSSISPKQMPRRESRVCENFSRPVSRYPRNGSESSIGSVPPISLQQQQQQQQQKPILAASPVLESESEPEPVVDHSRKVSLSQMNLTALFESTESLSLEDVPEEPTGTNWHDSPVEEIREPTREPLPVPESSSTLAPPPAPVFVTGRKFSEALASPTIPQYFQTTESEMPHQHQYLPEDVSHADVLDAVYDSWDADIDYCYEHAAESTSNFDWSRRSFEDQQHPTILEEEPEPQPSIHLSTSSLFCPDLDPSPSSRSVPSTQMLATPSTAYSEYFQGPMLPLAAADGKPMPIQEPLYSDDYSDQDRHLSFCSQGGVNVIQAPMDQVSSPRSSFSPISNYNSQESLVLSRAASLVRKHRSSISATSSIPELVNSLSSHETMPTDSSSSFSSSLHHRPSKSLETSQIFGAAGSTGGHGLGLGQSQISTHPEESSHDRTKSTSDIIYKDLPPLPSVKGHKRAAYSLFPGQ